MPNARIVVTFVPPDRGDVSAAKAIVLKSEPTRREKANTKYVHGVLRTLLSPSFDGLKCSRERARIIRFCCTNFERPSASKLQTDPFSTTTPPSDDTDHSMAEEVSGEHDEYGGGPQGEPRFARVRYCSKV